MMEDAPLVRMPDDLPFPNLRVALVHDWLTGMRGGEKVLEAFARLFPQATIHTLVHDAGSVSPAIEALPIRTSPLQNIPFGLKRYRYFLPLYPWLTKQLAIEGVDLVLSTSSCIAKAAPAPIGSIHASYVLTPMRYLYDRFDDYFAPGRASLPTRVAMRLCRDRLKRWDMQTAQGIDAMACTSSFIRRRIEGAYRRTATVIFPPVDVDRFASRSREPDDYYLMVSALVPYKNVETAIEAFRQLDRRLIIVGTGPLARRLQRRATSNIELRGWVDDEQLPDLVAGCRAFLMPNVEDFGIAAVEAMAAGRPVIALGQGGALDTVRDLDRWRAGQLAGNLGPTGLLYSHSDANSLAKAIRRFEREARHFEPDDANVWAKQFDQNRFEQEIVAWLSALLAGDSGAFLPAEQLSTRFDNSATYARLQPVPSQQPALR